MQIAEDNPGGIPTTYITLSEKDILSLIDGNDIRLIDVSRAVCVSMERREKIEEGS